MRSDTGLALRVGVTVIGAPLKASAFPEQMVSKLTTFVGFRFTEHRNRRYALSYAATASGFRAALNTEIVSSSPSASLKVGKRELVARLSVSKKQDKLNCLRTYV